MISILNLLLLIVFIYLIKSNYKKYIKFTNNDLKGPFPLPIIGNLHNLGEKPHITCEQLVKKYGKIYRLYFGDCYTVVVSDIDIIKELFLNNHESLKERPLTPSFKHCSDDEHGILLSSKRWDRNREMLQKVMKKINIKELYKMIYDQVEDMVLSFKSFENSGEALPVRLVATRFTLSTMFKYIFNEKVSYNEDINTGVVSMFAEWLEFVFDMVGVGHVGDYIEILKPFYSLYLKQFEHYVPIGRDFVYQRYIKHVKKLESLNEESNCLLDLLIREYNTDDSEDARDIVANCLDMLVAGTDTPSKTLEWTILNLVNHQDIQENVYQEIKRVVGDRDKVKLGDRPSTPYFNSVCKEVIRIHSIVPFGVPRIINKDLMLKGFYIPKGSQVVINYRALNHDKKYFQNPEDFDPQRFIDGDSAAYLPFSLGKRNCIGRELASSIIYLFLSNLLLNYKISSIDNKPLEINENFGINIKPNSFKIVLNKR
ncbi:hypothetical protein DICPUDRAFT_77397 [Dictyostelium purpureum]|uniref:Cytochrome P450 family protein n=1 Tax=Dictyostelium purpureum TaxID=5786 RepID=F0ZGH5_DICPU|nr:uncharacterized protein DICPUDRAFT_77397 [Dictyostelium purpureum]EGC36945.1 hypothetical protein DICPUDRAFT_77397 [Dictyostelium purpureum]|eukprot:XP_003286513.1 hypothetical protein DICPUDRAFT_77397 [Dictyostelium purpureum]